MPLEDTLEDAPQQSSALGNAKWWIVGGLGILLVFILMKKKGSSSGSATGQPMGGASNIDPSTGFPVGSSADVAALRTYGALGGGGRFNMGAYPTSRGGGGGTNVSQVGLGGAYLPPYEPINSAWIHGLPEPSFPVGPAGQPGPGNSGATGLNQTDIMTGSQALTTQATVPINDKSASHTRVYRVKPGDNLAGIAAKFGVAGGTSSLYKHNRHTLGPNPNLLIPGTLIYL
jgi:hypothetical protein